MLLDRQYTLHKIKLNCQPKVNPKIHLHHTRLSKPWYARVTLIELVGTTAGHTLTFEIEAGTQVTYPNTSYRPTTSSVADGLPAQKGLQ